MSGKIKWRWHLPKWAVVAPTPIKRAINLRDMDTDGLRGLWHWVHARALGQPRGPRQKYLSKLLRAIIAVLQLSPLERLAGVSA